MRGRGRRRRKAKVKPNPYISRRCNARTNRPNETLHICATTRTTATIDKAAKDKQLWSRMSCWSTHYSVFFTASGSATAGATSGPSLFLLLLPSLRLLLTSSAAGTGPAC